MGALADAVPALLEGAARRVESAEGPLERGERIGLARLLRTAKEFLEHPADEVAGPDEWERRARSAARDLAIASRARSAQS